jgi:uncharacterized RDD family membrane protein YckC
VTEDPAWLTSVPQEARAFQGRRAGVVSRVLAAAVDLALLLVLLTCLYLGWAGLLLVIDPVRFKFPTPSRVLILTAAAVVLVGYLTESWTTSGRTFGDRVLGLRVVDRQGRRLRHGRAVLRALFCTVFPVGLLWVAVSGGRHSIQDMVLRTAVIYDWSPHQHPQQPRR